MPSRRKITALAQISGSTSRDAALFKRRTGTGQGRSPKRAWLRTSGMAPPEPTSHHGSRFSEWFAPRVGPNVSVYIQPSTPIPSQRQSAGQLSELGQALTSVQQTLRQSAVVPETKRRPGVYQHKRAYQKSHPPAAVSNSHEGDSPISPHTSTNGQAVSDFEPGRGVGSASNVLTGAKPASRNPGPLSCRAPVHSLADAVALGLRSDTMPHARHRTRSARPWGKIDGESNKRHIAAVAQRTLDRRMTMALILTVIVVGASVVTLIV